MNDSPSVERYRKSLDDHRELSRLTRELIDFLDRPRPDVDTRDGHAWAAMLYRQLVELHIKLSLNYRAQEEAGLMREFAEHHPRAASRLDELRAEHGALLDELRAIVSASMTYAEARTPPNPRLREWTRSLLEGIARHEEQETLLIQELSTTDVGTGD